MMSSAAPLHLLRRAGRVCRLNAWFLDLTAAKVPLARGGLPQARRRVCLIQELLTFRLDG